eukprot:106574-Chlamydomonas_euryale.AAC.2
MCYVRKVTRVVLKEDDILRTEIRQRPKATDGGLDIVFNQQSSRLSRTSRTATLPQAQEYSLKEAGRIDTIRPFRDCQRDGGDVFRRCKTSLGPADRMFACALTRQQVP